jgi:hypothetical protein
MHQGFLPLIAVVGVAYSRTLRTLNTLARLAHKLGLETARVLGSGVV